MTRTNSEARQSCYYEPLAREKMKFLKRGKKPKKTEWKTQFGSSFVSTNSLVFQWIQCGSDSVRCCHPAHLTKFQLRALVAAHGKLLVTAKWKGVSIIFFINFSFQAQSMQCLEIKSFGNRMSCYFSNKKWNKRTLMCFVAVLLAKESNHIGFVNDTWNYQDCKR